MDCSAPKAFYAISTESILEKLPLVFDATDDVLDLYEMMEQVKRGGIAMIFVMMKLKQG